MRPTGIVTHVGLPNPVHPQDGIMAHTINLGVQGARHILAVLDPVYVDGLVTLND